MQHNIRSIRPFIGAENFEVSRSFYRDLGFEETVLFHEMSVFKSEGFAFYLQNGYIKDWIDNTQVFVEVENVESLWQQLIALGLDVKYKGVRLTPVRTFSWGRECYVHDPSGILWHFGEFNKPASIF